MAKVLNKFKSGELGQGIFLIKDVSEILRLPYSKVRYWLNEFWDYKFAKKWGAYSFGDEKNRAVNFYTLIEFLAFYKFREVGITAQSIQKAHENMAKDLNSQFPFATKELFVVGKDIHYGFANEVIKADGRRQIASKKLLKKYLKNIEFENEIAARYFPIGKDKDIVVDPKYQFGQPTVKGTGIKAETIYNLYRNGESKKNICFLYNLSAQQVNSVMLYYKKTKGVVKAAA